MAIKLGKGTEVTHDISGTSTPIAQVESVTIGEVSTDVEEIETLEDTKTYPVKIPVKNTYGDITVTVIYDPSVHSVLDQAAKNLYAPGTTYQITVQGYGTWEFVGVSAADVSIEKSKVIKRQYRFIIQGPVTT